MLRLGSKSDVNSEHKCTVRLLDDNEVIECEFQPRHKAQFLLDFICRELNVEEKDYFGLRYVDHRKHRRWMDLTKSIMKQVRDMSPIVVCFRVKFYPPEPQRLREETRTLLYLQLKRDLQHGRLYSPGPGNEMAMLVALATQVELGDYDAERHPPGYITALRPVLQLTERLEAEVESLHQADSGGVANLSPAQAEMAFLRRACLLDTFGIDPHPVKDARGIQLYLGANYSGVLTFQNGRKTHHFRWNEVSKLNYEGKMFIVHLAIAEDARTKKKHTVGFKCANATACRLLWRSAVEQRLFFTLSSSSEIPAVVTGGSFFSRGSKVRYSGRVERELSEDWVRQANARRAPHLSRRSFSVPVSANSHEEVLPRNQSMIENVPDDSSAKNNSADDTDIEEELKSEVAELRSKLTEDGSSLSTRTSSTTFGPSGDPGVDYRDSFDQSSSGSQAESDLANSFIDHFGPPSHELEVDFYGYNESLAPPQEYGATYRAEYYNHSPRQVQRRSHSRLSGNHSELTPPSSVGARRRHPRKMLHLSPGLAVRHNTPAQTRGSARPLALHAHDPLAQRLAADKTHCTPGQVHLPSSRRPILPPFRPFRLFFVIFGVVLASFALVLIGIFEWDALWVFSVRQWPELLLLRRVYYDPLRNFLVRLMAHGTR